MSYKKTLLMPQTNFEMKANLNEKEKFFREKWLKNDIYNKALEFNKENKTFILHDGPPYANGDLHVGHALNKILKDIVIRRKIMQGFYAPYLPGWDTHGLPIENKMLEELKMTKDDLDKISLRKEAAKYALRQVENQKSQFEKMQLFSPLDNKYLTLDKEFEVGQLKLFKKMILKGLIFKGLKPIYWSPSSQSALAEAEVEYKDHMAPQIIVALEILSGNKYLNANDFLLIMTTTPWTLIANAGVAINKDFDYDIIKVNNKKYVIASQLTSDVAKKVKWDDYKIIAKVTGSDLVNIKYRCPIKKELTASVVFGPHVTNESGTGLVHMAPLFGEDDYLIGKEKNLNMIMHVDDKGYLNKEAGEFENMFYEDANKAVGLKLDAEGKLLSLKFLNHSYPHDWRTNKPIIYRGVPQWFVNIKSIKKNIMDELKKVTSYPTWGKDRLIEMIDSRNEWTISRQRTWGVPIIVFYDKNKNPIIEEELFDHIIDLVKKHGTNIWWEWKIEDLLPKSYWNKDITKEMDIMDVWFDSGSSSIAVDVNGIKAPFDLYLEGSDQYRGWFNSSLINSVAYRNKSPFKSLISHGFVVDGNNQKMSKSKGNVINPMEIIKNHGADILRLWVANCEYISDITISKEIIKQTIELYRKIRNTIRFILGNLHDFNFAKDNVKLQGFHQHIANKIQVYKKNVDDYFSSYNFKNVIKATNNILVNLSGWYLNYAKDVLYCDKKNNVARRQIQTNMFNFLIVVLKTLAPIIPTTIEEAYLNMANFSKKESIFLERIETKNKRIVFKKEWINFEEKIRPLINNLIEAKIKQGVVKRSNELILVVPKNDKLLKDNKIAKYLLVAKLEFGMKFKVKTFISHKCNRCWNYFTKNEIKNNICMRCSNVLGI